MKKLNFQNLSDESVVISGILVHPGYHVAVTLPDDWDEQEGIGEGGPWGWGGYTTEYLERVAEEIERA